MHIEESGYCTESDFLKYLDRMKELRDTQSRRLSLKPTEFLFFESTVSSDSLLSLLDEFRL